MKIFEVGSKVNFVDSNNVFVGYDIGQECCEEPGWYFKCEPTEYSYDGEYEDDPNTDSYNFDPDYFDDAMGGDLDGGGMVVFRLVSDSEPDIYLHVFNSHNGYYSHGFEFKRDGVMVAEGYL